MIFSLLVVSRLLVLSKLFSLLVVSRLLVLSKLCRLLSVLYEVPSCLLLTETADLSTVSTLLLLSTAVVLAVSFGCCCCCVGVVGGLGVFISVTATFFDGRRSTVVRPAAAASSFLRREGVLATGFFKGLVGAPVFLPGVTGELRPLAVDRWPSLAVGLRVNETSEDLVEALEGVRERSLLLEDTELVGEGFLVDDLVGSFVLN